jgi:hypothetical protein
MHGCSKLYNNFEDKPHSLYMYMTTMLAGVASNSIFKSNQMKLK